MADFGTTDISISNDSSSDQSLAAQPSSSSKQMPALIEIQKKPRGRPPGSKNKPKPPIIITKDNESSMKPIILDIPTGSDIIDSIIKFAMKNHVGLTILSASGSVSDVTLCQPISHTPSLSLQGPFNLLALSGSFIVASTCSFGISLAGAQGQVFGGIVAGKVMAATQVVVVAATFINPTVYRMPLPYGNEQEDRQEEESKGNSVYGNVANPTPINCHISPDIMHWPHPRRC